MFLFDFFVKIDHFSDIRAFFDVGAVEEAAFEAIDDDISQLVGGELEVLNGEVDFVGDGGVGDGAVIGADADAEFVVEHTAEAVFAEAFEFGHRLEVAGEADFDGDAAFSDELGELVDVFFTIFDAWILDAVFAVEMVAMADAVGV